MAFSAIDCVLCGERAIYGSTELTTGRRLYDVLREVGLPTAAAFKEKLGRDEFTNRVWNPNFSAALEFAKDIRQSCQSRTLVISPAPFTAPGWTQPEYLAFWETLLRTRIQQVWLNRNWQFSNGCTFEFAVAIDAGLPTADHDGHALSVDQAIDLITDAIATLNAESFDTSSLKANLERITTRRKTATAVL
jgi:hypothetical protein